MDILSGILQPILDAGSTVFMPIIMTIVGLIVGLKFKEALNCGLLTGVAFCAVSLVMSYLSSTVGPILSGFITNTGLQLDTIDVGWTVASAITWAWPNVFLIFPITFVINIIMLVFKWTDTMNVDIWNYWGKAYTAALVQYFCGNLWIGLGVAAIQTVLELKTADCMALPFQDVTGIPGITSTHCMFMKGAFLYPIDWVVKKIPGLNKEFNIDVIKKKVGVFGEIHFIGFIVGLVLALISGQTLADSANIGVKLGCALLLFPRVSKIFMEALEPISDAAGNFLRKKFKGRDLFVGLDWPFLAGRSETWLVGLLLVPINLFLCAWMASMGWNNILPINTIMFTGGALNILVYSNGNVLRMLIGSIIALPLYYVAANYAAPALTALGTAAGFAFGDGVDKIALLGDDAPFWRMAWQYIFSDGKVVIGLIILILYIVGFVVFYKGMMKESAAIRAKREASNS